MILIPFGFMKANIAAGLPSPWLATDIGSPGIAGTSSYDAGTFTLNATGNDLAGTADDFHFVYRPWSGNGIITARVASLEDTGNTPMAGVMFRETLATGSKFASMMLRPANAVFRRRAATDGTSTSGTSGSLSAPYWIRVERSGNTFSGYRSANGTDWTQLATGVTITMGTDIYVGLAGTSNEADDVCTATFDNVGVA